MIILTRQVSEAINIDDKVTITVLEVQGMQVRLGVSAPKDVAIHRKEVYERIQKQPEK